MPFPPSPAPKDGEARTQELFGKKVLVLPYVMPGFVLAKQVFEVLQKTDLRKEGIEGIVLLKHGLFTFADDAKASYEKHIELVTKAEAFLAQKVNAVNPVQPHKSKPTSSPSPNSASSSPRLAASPKSPASAPARPL
jgi:rhamnose utilization protein RhaD (predicted bifunctional aldolase and dehydrogenase)